MTSKHIRSHQDPDSDVAWLYLKPVGRACFTPEILTEMLAHCRHVEVTGRAPGSPLDAMLAAYHVVASDVPGTFNLGGDLFLFYTLIKSQDRWGLLQYATQCIDIQWSRLQHFGREIATISLVQGRALGGGMEGAIASDYVIAERGATLGVPEIKFSLFPGMGAYSILSRKVGRKKAEELMSTGQILSASEAHDLGIVDVLVEDGQGASAVQAFIREHRGRAVGLGAILRCRDFQDPITHDELMGITRLWVETALRLPEKHLRTMDALIQKQNRLVDSTGA